MPVLTVRLDDDIYRRLSHIAERNQRTKSSYIKEMLDMYMDDYEGAQTALDRLNQKNAKYLSTAELEAELGL